MEKARRNMSISAQVPEDAEEEIITLGNDIDTT